jgi:putative membrane protein
MSSILNDQERSRLAELVAKVELSTAGELVLVVAPKSASYGAYRAAWAAAVALFAAVLVHVAWPSLATHWLLAGQGVLGLLLWWCFGYHWLLRRITPRSEQQRAVSDRVRQLFLERGVTETRERSGVLILLSELEHRVEILGDRGVHQQVGTEAWQAMVKELVGALRVGRAAEGLTAIVERIGHELATKFPRRPDDVNELPDAVVTDRRHG